VAVFLGFDYCLRDIRFVIWYVIGALLFATGMELASSDNSPVGETHFLPNPALHIQLYSSNGRGDVLGTDVAFGETFLVG
jgi:hypothetical protein